MKNVILALAVCYGALTLMSVFAALSGGPWLWWVTALFYGLSAALQVKIFLLEKETERIREATLHHTITINYSQEPR